MSYDMRRFKWYALVALGVAVVLWLLLPAFMPYKGLNAGPQGQVSRALLGAPWPFTVDEGTIECDHFAILFRAPGGQRYAVNAQARRLAPQFESKDASEITLPGMSVQPIIDIGQAYCNY